MAFHVLERERKRQKFADDVSQKQVNEFEKAIQDMEEGSTVKPVLVW